MHKTFATIIDDQWVPEYRRQNWAVTRYLFSLWALALYLVPAGLVTRVILGWLGVPRAGAAILVVLAAAVTIFTIWFFQAARLNRLHWEDFFRHFRGRPVSWDIDDSGLRITGPNGMTAVGWDVLREIHCYRSDWHLQFVGAHAFVPVRFLDDEFRNFLVDRVRAQGVTVFIEGPCLQTRGELPPVPSTVAQSEQVRP